MYSTFQPFVLDDSHFPFPYILLVAGTVSLLGISNAHFIIIDNRCLKERNI
jgi:hypothetical protein